MKTVYGFDLNGADKEIADLKAKLAEAEQVPRPEIEGLCDYLREDRDRLREALYEIEQCNNGECPADDRCEIINSIIARTREGTGK